jgi:Bifunctional DNA primase/polymerase, N-terminal/AAA domain
VAKSPANNIVTLNFDGLPSKWKTPLDAALFYARDGMKIFPCRYVKVEKGKLLPEENWKQPPLDGWPDGATADVEQIKKWWKRWPDALIGHRPGDSGCVVFDVDVKHGSPGKANWDAFGFDLDDCARVARTRTGGWHYTYQRGDVGPVSNKDLCPGVNVRCDNGYVILPSPENGYHWEQWGVVEPMPPKLADLLRSVQRDTAAAEGDADGEDLPPHEVFEAALVKWRGRIRAKRPWWKEHLKNRWGSSDKTGERSDDLHRMEHDCCERGISEKDCFLLIWPLDICKFRCDGRRQGERQLRREIKEVYAGHKAKNGENPAGSPFRLLSEVIEKEVKYFWPPYAPYSMVTMVEGQRYQGKSYILHWMIAHATRGRSPQFALDRANHDKTDIEPLTVLYLSKGENPSDFVLKPRIRVMGGDMTKFQCLDDDPNHEYYDLVFDDEGLQKLEEIIEIFRPKLIAVDSLNSFVPEGINAGVANQIKPLIEKLARSAAKAEAAMLIVRHWRKASGSALNMASGLVDIGAVARSVLTVACDRKDDSIRYMAHAGATVGKRGPTLKFHLDGDPVADLFWDGHSDLTADDLARGGEKSALDDAKEFLLDYLKDGPKPKEDVEVAAAARGHAEHTLRRAKDDLGVIVFKEAGVAHGRWWWKLPQK